MTLGPIWESHTQTALSSQETLKLKATAVLQWCHNECGGGWITGVSMVCSAISSGADQRKYQMWRENHARGDALFHCPSSVFFLQWFQMHIKGLNLPTTQMFVQKLVHVNKKNVRCIPCIKGQKCGKNVHSIMSYIQTIMKHKDIIDWICIKRGQVYGILL